MMLLLFATASAGALGRFVRGGMGPRDEAGGLSGGMRPRGASAGPRGAAEETTFGSRRY